MPGSSTLPDDHDAQRTLEQKSLRNVRTLLDKLETQEEIERRTRRRIGWALLVLAVLSIAGGVAFLESRHHRSDLFTLTPPAR